MRMIAAILLAVLSLASHAEAIGYDFLVVSCSSLRCDRLLEGTWSGDSREATQYRQNGIQIQVLPLATRPDAVDARVTIEIQADPPATSSPVPQATRSEHLRVVVEPQRLRPVRYRTVASLSRDDVTYQVWARLGTAPVPAPLASANLALLARQDR